MIAGNNSSQIEVVGDAGLLFNVARADELSDQLLRILDDPGWSRELGERAVAQARRFRWEDTADKALEVLTRTHTPKSTIPVRTERRRAPRRRIAFFSPLPPSPSAVSEYSARLLDELIRRYTIDLYHDADYLPHLGLNSHEFGCHDYRLFERNARVLGYHAVVYEMGNSHYHRYILETLLRHPGIVTMHDVEIADFHVWCHQRPSVNGHAHIQREFEAFRGMETDDLLQALASPDSMPGSMPQDRSAQVHQLNGRIFDQATAVIMHSPWCAEQVRNRFPDRFGKVTVVAFGATALDPPTEQRKVIRTRLDVPQEALVIVCLGPVQPSKLNSETMAAFAQLAQAIPDALLIFVGDEQNNGEARRKAKELALDHCVRFQGHHPPRAMADLAAIADIGVCLQQLPANGETSAALLDFLRLGVPTIVSDVGPFSYYPDSVVRKHRWDPGWLAGLTEALRELAENKPRREALGRAAWHYVQQHHGWPHAADSYEEIIERTAARRTQAQADGTLKMPDPQIVASPELLQAAS